MPTPQAEEPLVKTTLNLFKADVDYLKRLEPQGWSSWVRMIVRQHIINRKERYNEHS